MKKIILKNKRIIFERLCTPNSWWYSHTMAPSAIIFENKIRIFLGGWDQSGISRITFIDVDINNPEKIIFVNDEAPVLDCGEIGCFDDNGVFPAHVSIFNDKVFLYYTGFQKLEKIPHTNFNGLAKNLQSSSFQKISSCPILDRADEGRYVRAGLSVIKNKNEYISVYSGGSSFELIGGKLRPNYDVYLQINETPTTFKSNGKKILSIDNNVEHGLGRPQIINFNGEYYVFYTRRLKNMNYEFGCSVSEDLEEWTKIELDLGDRIVGFDDQMVYFPSVLMNQDGQNFLFFCGNNFGKTGIGCYDLYFE